MNNKYEFDGRRLALVREERDMLQKELAASIGVKEGTITAYERNCATPSPQKLALIADVLDISLDYLFGLSNDMVSYKKPNYVILPPDSPIELKDAFEDLAKIYTQNKQKRK